MTDARAMFDMIPSRKKLNIDTSSGTSTSSNGGGWKRGDVPPAKKSEKKEATEATPENLAEKHDVFLSTAKGQHPVVADKNFKSADFYRDGKIATQYDNVYSEDGTIDPRNADYEILPRTITETQKDEPASIRVIGKAKNDSKSKDIDLIPAFSKIFLTSKQEGHQERSQIIETFGDYYVFFFGERPPIYTYTGVLLNYEDVNWVNDFRFYYDNFLRGTKCAENKAILVITSGFDQEEGFMLGFNMNKDSSMEGGVSVTFSVLIADRKIMTLSKDFGIIDANGRYTASGNIISLITKGMSEGETSDAYNTAKNVAQGEAASKTKTLTASAVDYLKEKYSDVSSEITTIFGKVSTWFE